MLRNLVQRFGARPPKIGDSMADKVYPKGNGIGIQGKPEGRNFRLICGCLGWSSERPDLVLCYCAKHDEDNAERQTTMRKEALVRNGERIRFSPRQIQENLKRFGV